KAIRRCDPEILPRNHPQRVENIPRSGLRQLQGHNTRKISGFGVSAVYISGELADWLEDQQMDHVRGAPYHPQTQGKIERWHQTLKNRILLENYYLPGDLTQQIDAFVEHYNHRRYHESLQNLTPADVYFGRGQTILRQRERIKQKTIETRRLLHRKSAA
ncbi:integrase core domain-containing protein, partial [Phaeobacter sp.]|uniref:integrase core domain-containing protein n=1 Tax=Phaeobacter sp. TaxID=1902409 RepID=UPI0025F242E9